MFEQTFVSVQTKRDRSLGLALVLQCLAVSGLSLAPLWHVGALEPAQHVTILPPTAKLVREEQPPPKTAAVRSRQTPFRAVVLPPVEHPFRASSAIPALLQAEPPAVSTGSAQETPSIPGADFGAAGRNSMFAEAGGARSQPERPHAVRLTSAISRSQLVFAPNPAYPPIARMARVEGSVKIEAVISRAGTVEKLHVVSGNPLLVSAAVEAVRQWRYRPLLLNGEPMEVLTEIDITFTLR